MAQQIRCQSLILGGVTVKMSPMTGDLSLINRVYQTLLL